MDRSEAQKCYTEPRDNPALLGRHEKLTLMAENIIPFLDDKESQFMISKMPS